MKKLKEEGLDGIGAKSRQQLSQVLRHSRGIISPRDVGQILGISPKRAAHLVSRWAKGGWLTRIRRGLYIPHELGAEQDEAISIDPWVIASRAFEPCYIGGWSAAHHWGFTDQLFETTVIVTGRRCNSSQQRIGGHDYILKQVRRQKLFGTMTITRGGAPIEISDEARTIIDGLDTPRSFGGIRMVIDAMRVFLASDFTDPQQLLSYADRLGEKAVYHRLGYLLEHLAPDHQALIEECEKNLSVAYNQLDPMTPGNLRVKRWRLIVPDLVQEQLMTRG